jgi:hypothetical protein
VYRVRPSRLNGIKDSHVCTNGRTDERKVCVSRTTVKVHAPAVVSARTTISFSQGCFCVLFPSRQNVNHHQTNGIRFSI